MIEFTEAVRISCAVSRVWSALTNPTEVALWDTGIQAAIDAPRDYPRPGQHVCWRYRLGLIPLTLHDRPSEVVPNRTLRSDIRLGPFDFDETYTLSSISPTRTELSARLCLSSHAPLVGRWLERWPGRSLAISTVRESLAAIRVHCESTAAYPPWAGVQPS